MNRIFTLLILFVGIISPVAAKGPMATLKDGKIQIVGSNNSISLEGCAVDLRKGGYYSVTAVSDNRFEIYVWNVDSYLTNKDGIVRINLSGQCIDFVDRVGYGASLENKYGFDVYGKIERQPGQMIITIGEIIGIGKMKSNQKFVLNSLKME